MATTEATEQKSASAQAVDEEYEKLQMFHVERQRIVLIDENYKSEGGYGIVRRAELYQSASLPTWVAEHVYGPPQLVAVKQIRVSDFTTMKRAKRAFTREMLVWSSLGAHPGIAKFLGFHADFTHSKAWLLSPWEPNGNISEFVNAHNLEVPEKVSLVHDTIDALNFLHRLEPPVCHGDIKSANVLVSADYKARLCDFGLARLHEDSGFKRLETSTATKGSIRWCSPEILNDARRAPTSDVYAWAWLVWEIMTGEPPYQGTNADTAVMIQIFASPLPQVDGQSRLSDCLQVWELMKRCWNVDPLQRPTARMCKTTVTYLPRCTPTPRNAEQQPQSPGLLENLGDLESWRGNPEKSSAYLDEALRLYQKEADAKGIASVLRKQTVAAYRILDFAKLHAIATAAVEHCKTLNDTLGTAEALFYLGYSVRMRGDLEEALPILCQSLEIRRAHGDDADVIQCLERIGEIQRAIGLKQEALSTLGEAVEVTSRSGDEIGLALALHMVGVTHTERSDFVKASDALSEAITISRKIRLEGRLSVTLSSMGRLKMRLGDYPAAETLFQESIHIARHIRDRFTLAQGLEELGECLHKQSRPDEAAALLEEACLFWRELSQPSSSKNVASSLVDLKSSQGDWDGALLWHDHIITVCRSQKEHSEVADHLEVADQLELKGEVLVKAQRYDEAALHFEAAMLTRMESMDSWPWPRRQLGRQLSAIPKTAMKWERRLPILCDIKKLQRRQPQLVTASLKFAIPIIHEES